ncbi:hypothetical protein BJX99DRAFT_251846 [Aspergillus californicus]
MYISNSPDRGFFENLDACIRRYKYQGNEQFLRDFETEQQRYSADEASEWLLLTDIDNTTFDKHFIEPVDETTPFTSWSSYDAVLGLLLVRLLDAVRDVRMKGALSKLGSSTHEAATGAKEPDNSWRPARSPEWPSVVLEVAYSETPRKLQSDVVFTIKIGRREPTITIESWQPQMMGDHVQPHLQQVTEISKDGNGNVTISDAPLVLGFEDLFLRPPSSRQEHNMEFDARQSQSIAEQIWDIQGF